ncbi:MAG: hypothetical protein PHC64_09320, partial [Candidatus Gastranaerophilales bacterium]|nr:hypothetical protein [Candidatus Gastranaerophilales bacterium]
MNDTEILNYIKKSFELKNQGFYKPAIEMLYKALAIDGENFEILTQLAHLYKLLGNFPRAISYIEKVLEINAKHFDCMSLLEEIYLIQDNLECAKDVSEKIYELQPTSQNLAKKINILNKLNCFDEIKEIEKSSLELNDEVLYEIACAYYANNYPEKSLQLLELGHAKNNKNKTIMLLMAKIYYELKNFKKSKPIFEELSQTAPSAEIQNYLGLFSLNEKNFSQAVEYFSQAQSLEEKNPEYA